MAGGYLEEGLLGDAPPPNYGTLSDVHLSVSVSAFFSKRGYFDRPFKIELATLGAWVLYFSLETFAFLYGVSVFCWDCAFIILKWLL